MKGDRISLLLMSVSNMLNVKLRIIITSVWSLTIDQTKIWSGLEFESGIFNVYIFIPLVIKKVYMIYFTFSVPSNI